MGIAAPKIRVARKEHRCSEESYHVIRPGSRYLYAAGPPWADWNSSKKWWVIRACLRCADRYGLHTSDTRKAVEG
jgi:hypothetical protein